MLRYVLVDCQAEMIPLSKEIKYVENFIDFQMMRMGGYRDVHFEKDVEKEDFMIAPMLLQPIIENCFKYSRLETHPDGYVHVKVQQSGNKFRFEAVNTVAENAKSLVPVNEPKKSGIGLNNVQQRLMLHYGEDYVFEIKQDKGIYKVKIEL
jgi:sensor histidine kinase YesM